VNGPTQGVLLAGTGTVVARLAATGAYLNYLKEGMRFPLLAAGLAMVALGTLTLVRALVPDDEIPDDAAPDDAAPGDPPDREDHPGGHVHHDHHAHGGPRVAWLLVLPLLGLLLIVPGPLGADAARRDTTAAAPPRAEWSRFAPLAAPRDGAVDLPLGVFLSRAYYDDDDSLGGVPVRLTGFVVADPAIPDGYRLTRYLLTCCAADAMPLQVVVQGLGSPPPADDTWLEVVGTWVPPADPTAEGVDRGAVLAVTSQVEIPPPANPYE
jgi:uncharacterized repeat protein (TIGR03943 family)